MRIIAGEGRGRRIRAPRGLNTRPTADRVREALFNILASNLQECRFLDLYAGSGGIGLEALSRGAGEVVFVEKNPEATAVIEKNIKETKLPGEKKVYRADVPAFIRSQSPTNPGFNIVFLDPPYKQGLEQRTLEAISGAPYVLKDKAVVVVESARSIPPLERVGTMVLVRHRAYGDTALSFYRMEEA